MPKDLDVVRLRDGRECVIVFVYRGGAAYAVEFSNPSAVITVEPEEIAEVIYESPERATPGQSSGESPETFGTANRPK